MLLNKHDIIKGDKGTYQIQGQIGSDSTFGVVYKALNKDGEPVVIKQLKGADNISGNVGMDYNYARTTFEREAEILLTHNSNRIVRGHDYFQKDDDVFLVMEFINGKDLDQVLNKYMTTGNQQPFSEDEAVPIAMEICLAVHSIHQMPGQVLYRDMKPRNIMWDAPKQTIKIIDFGTARFMDKGMHATQALGTPGYSPPEFYSTKQTLSFASDVYTIGATLFELVTGEVPEPFTPPAHFHGYDGKLSSGFKSIIRTAMQQKSRERYQTAEDMYKALSALPAAAKTITINSKPVNPHQYFSCYCPKCGTQPNNEKSVFCTDCGGKIHVIMLRIQSVSDPNMPAVDLYINAAKKENLIGREDIDENIFPEVNLDRYDPKCVVSRKHCILKRDGTRFYIKPMNTKNPTLLNNISLQPEKTVEISANDKLMLANLIMSLMIKPCIN